MTAKVIVLRPSSVPPIVPGPRPVRPRRTAVRPAVLALDGPVSVDWDETRGLHVAACSRCCESFDALTLDQADEWADSHHCDPELVALLADITRPARARGRRAA